MRTIAQKCFIIGLSLYVIFIIGLIINTQNIHDKTPMEIYIAGKYSGDVEINVKNAIDKAQEMQFMTCNYPIVPHLWGHTQSLWNYTYQEWMDYDTIALIHADAVYKISSSHGSDEEENLAKKLGKPIYYSLQQIPTHCKDLYSLNK